MITPTYSAISNILNLLVLSLQQPEVRLQVLLSPQELRLVPNIHGNGFVQLGRSSSKLSKAEMSELMALIEAFAAEHGVTLWEDEEV